MTRNDIKKNARKMTGGAVYTVGVAAKLAEWGFSVSEVSDVVFNGAKNLANSFVKAPELGIGKSLLDGGKKLSANVSNKMLEAGRDMMK